MKTTIKKGKNFNKFINKKGYQVFLFSSKTTFPAFFAKHYWFVINKKNKLMRIEIFHKKNKKNKLGYIYTSNKNLSKPLIKYIWNKNIYWKKSRLHKIIHGKEAKKLIFILEKSLNSYIFKNKYLFYPGPNSNTYVQKIIDQIPELNLKLSYNAFGKNYKKN